MIISSGIKRALTFTPLLSLFLIGSGQAATFDHTHAQWTAVLSKYVQVDGGKSTVDYKSLKADEQELSAYTHSLTAVTQAQFDQFTSDEKLAFLINAYNASTVKLIVDNYPLDSIKDLGSTFSSIFKKGFIPLLGKKMSLDDIEHGTIRKMFKEPRIHFAVNCASKSCPALQTEAYTSARLDAQLEKSTRAFLRDPERNRLEGGKLFLTKLFDWYGDDFKNKFGSIRKFIAPRMSDDPKVQEKISSEQTDIEYMKYNWSLNDRSEKK